MSKKAATADRRSAPRKEPRAGAGILIRRREAPAGTNLALMFLDLSEGGVRAVVAEPLGKGDPVEVLLKSYGMRQAVRAIGQVAWVVRMADDAPQCCVGITFDQRLSAEDVAGLSFT